MEYILENKSILLLSGLLALIFVFIKDKWVTNQPVGNEIDLFSKIYSI